MPQQYLFIHIIFILFGIFAIQKYMITKRPLTITAAFILFLVLFGLSIERRSELSWWAMRWGFPDLLFFTNLSLFGAVTLTAILWKSAIDKASRQRSVILGVALTCIALWSYAWLYTPAPEGITGKCNSKGYCRQTTDETCSAAAAVMLLHRNGIETTEHDMAVLCLTRKGGTMPLGLYYGISKKAAPYQIRVRIGKVSHIADIPTPCIIEVGLRNNAPPAVAKQMQGYGWAPGLRHAVFIEKIDKDGKWMEVADPSFGQERWKSDGMEYIWDGYALYIDRK